MKYKILNQTDNRIELFVLYEDNTFMVLNLAQDTLDNVLKNAYILSKNIERLQYEGEVPTDLEVYEKPQSVATKITNVDFYNLTAKVYDQYGEIFPTDVSFTIEGEGAEIQDNKIIEKEVEEPTSYFIVAKVGDLEQKQERHIYPKTVPQPSEVDLLEAKLKASSERQDFLEELISEMAMQVYQ